MPKSNRESNYRYKNSSIDFYWDGMFSKERIKGKDKRCLRKKSQRRCRSKKKRMVIVDENCRQGIKTVTYIR